MLTKLIVKLNSVLHKKINVLQHSHVPFRWKNSFGRWSAGKKGESRYLVAIGKRKLRAKVEVRMITHNLIGRPMPRTEKLLELMLAKKLPNSRPSSKSLVELCGGAWLLCNEQKCDHN